MVVMMMMMMMMMMVVVVMRCNEAEAVACSFRA